MTKVNVALAGTLLTSLTAWADLTEDTLRRLHPDWKPQPHSYQRDLEVFVREEAHREAETYHPQGLELVKAAMRWVLTEAPDYAEEWYDGALCALEHPPEPMVLLWQWAWHAVFGEEPWRIEGETFELYVDYDEVVTKQGWNPERPSNPRCFTWPRPDST